MSAQIDMAELSLTGLQLLFADGVLPPNAARQALAFASPAQDYQLGTDGLAMNRAATLMAMESSSTTVELSSTALESLVQDMAAAAVPTSKAHASPAASEGSGYPYGGWSSSLTHSVSPELASAPGATSNSINVLA